MYTIASQLQANQPVPGAEPLRWQRAATSVCVVFDIRSDMLSTPQQANDACTVMTPCSLHSHTQPHILACF